MRSDFNLASLLEHVANGKMSVDKARNSIEKYFLTEASKLQKSLINLGGKKSKEMIQEEKSEQINSKINFSSAQEKKYKLKGVFDKFKQTVNLEDIFKIPSRLMHQISENVPQKLQEKFSPVGFSANIEGVDSKLSVFRLVQSTPPANEIKDNQVIGCQWFGVNISKNSKMKKNKFKAIQLSGFSLVGSDLCESNFSLSRMNHVTLQETCFMKNKFSLSAWSDTSVTESDFTQNSFTRSYFSGIVMNSSRLSKLSFLNVEFKDCEFDGCDIQGIEFDNCEFKDCSFQNLQVVASGEPVKISGCRLVGKQISECKSVEEFIQLLK
jgi:uncharacterized protein YjbI with pentapeptide repeats